MWSCVRQKAKDAGQPEELEQISRAEIPTEQAAIARPIHECRFRHIERGRQWHVPRRRKRSAPVAPSERPVDEPSVEFFAWSTNAGRPRPVPGRKITKDDHNGKEA